MQSFNFAAKGICPSRYVGNGQGILGKKLNHELVIEVFLLKAALYTEVGKNAGWHHFAIIGLELRAMARLLRMVSTAIEFGIQNELGVGITINNAVVCFRANILVFQCTIQRIALQNRCYKNGGVNGTCNEQVVSNLKQMKKLEENLNKVSIDFNTPWFSPKLVHPQKESSPSTSIKLQQT